MSIRDSQTLEFSIVSTGKKARSLSDENQSRLAQLMTIWISGYLEITCRDVLLAYVERKSDESVARFASQRLRTIRSPHTNEILKLVGSFDEDRAAKLQAFVRGRIADSVNSVVDRRNQIAHGQSIDTTLTTVEMQFEDTRKLAGKLKELFSEAV